MRLAFAYLTLALAALTAAQSAVPLQNTTKNHALPPPSSPNDTSVVLSWPSISRYFLMLPLTHVATTQLPHGSGAVSGLTGQLVIHNDTTTGTGLRSSDIAYINCNPDAYKGMIKLPTVVQQAITAPVRAILFYADNADYCNITQRAGYNNYKSIYSMERKHEGQKLLEFLLERPDDTQTIFTTRAYVQSQSTSQFGGANSTAVAMIILYSITGVITALFLIIIVTGAIRAHRHPERYGPRNVLGRPRQSRAKGIARAMLDTIPIVKFGETPPMEQNKDVESASNVQMAGFAAQTNNGDGAAERNEPQASAGASESQPTASASPEAAAASTSKSPSDPASAADEGTDEALGCSICTDDFERGQDIRVLPCNHKFHPACVDPWLLDVSGTCPLCRVDLHPAGSADGQDAADSDALPPPLDPTSEGLGVTGAGPRRRDTLRAFMSSRLNRGGQHETNPEERLEMLRRYRQANVEQTATEPSTPAPAETTTAAEDEARRTNRLNLFSRVMRRRER